MASAKLTVCGLFLAAGLAVSAQAETIVADFTGNFVAGTTGQTRSAASADGWDYLWNSAGNIGAAANYTSLVANSSNRYGTSTSYPDSAPGDYLAVGNGFGHPGTGVDNGQLRDYYAIAAYTIQTGEGGSVAITDSSFKVTSGGSNGAELRIYVNDTLVTNFVQAGGADAVSFNCSLGALDPDDTVFVAVGPNGHAASDGFNLSFKLESSPIPEPGTGAISLAAGLVSLLAYAWRTRR